MTFTEHVTQAVGSDLPADYTASRLASCTIKEEPGGRTSVTDTTGVSFSADTPAALATVLARHFTATAPSSIRHQGEVAYFDGLRKKARTTGKVSAVAVEKLGLPSSEARRAP